MVARMLALGLALGLSSLATLGLSPISAAQAAYPGWSAYSGQVKRPQFRPLNRAERPSAVGRWRPQMIQPTARAASVAQTRRPVVSWANRKAQQPILATERSWPRKAVAVPRGQDLGVRFRPDERGSLYTTPSVPENSQSAMAYQAQLHAQFRPQRVKRRSSYEQLQAQGLPARPVNSPLMPYPMVSAPPLPGYPGYWRNW